MKENNTKLSFICSFDDLESALVQILKISKSRLKKSSLSKNFLSKKILAKDEVSLPLDLVNWNKISTEYEGPSISMISDDEFFLVLNKPADMHGHPFKFSEHNSCLNFIASKKEFYELLSVNKENYERGLLYRLDYKTSGVLIYVKKEKIYNDLRKNYFDLVKGKEYVAVVSGYFGDDSEGEIRCSFKAEGVKRKRVKASIGPSTLEREEDGVMSVSKIGYSEKRNLSYIKIKLETGLRHQIRASLAAIDYPIVGDDLYGGAVSSRLFLHAHIYNLNINGVDYSYKAPVPELFSNLLDFDTIF